MPVVGFINWEANGQAVQVEAELHVWQDEWQLTQMLFVSALAKYPSSHGHVFVPLSVVRCLEGSQVKH